MLENKQIFKKKIKIKLQNQNRNENMNKHQQQKILLEKHKKHSDTDRHAFGLTYKSHQDEKSEKKENIRKNM